METKEGERVVVAKPVASRPTCSAYKSFSELLSGAINASSHIESSHTTVSVIRPKTVRLKPALNHPPAGFLSSQGDIFGAALSDSSDKSPKPDTKQSLIYKPIAKLVSKTTVSLLANIGNYSTSQQQPRQLMESNLQNPNIEKVRTKTSPNVHQSIAPHGETNQTSEPCRIVQQNSEEDLNSLASATNGDRSSYDGYNWRKYGQKKVKGSEYPRSYYKCTYPNCPVKKKVERSFDGQIAEIVYKGEHNHSKTQPPKHNSEGTQGSGLVHDTWSNNHNERNEANAGGGSKENSCGLSMECEEGRKGFEAQEDESRSKRRKNENQSNEASISEEGLVEPRIMVQSSTDSVVVGDGFRWRKYGQKVVKGSPYARSYYRCTNINCNVRKHVERAIDDPRAFVTTYEGKHNHEMPLKNSASVAYDKDSLSKNKP
ncbi:putative transcription factor WRKY family [Lupinus albus]|uniref:Putative transcription factor WRKY family n=1 Tax=Lupinus albus TaxID=3870 RepID=A0A6A4N6C0_LUPAL|nr:putative transcription factor WRKY family [Lupinus albus]